MDAMTVLHWLISLARFEEQSDHDRDQLRQAAKRRSDCSELLQECETDLEVATQREQTLAQQTRTHERSIQDLEARITQKRARQSEIRDNKEYQALSQELDNLRQQLDGEETSTLELIESMEDLQKTTATLLDELAAKKEERARLEAELAARITRAEAELAELDHEIQTCLSQLPPEIAVTLKRLRGKLPLPVVWLDEEACGGCHARFPVQVAIEISRGRTVERCQTCGRFVVPHP